MNIDLSFQDIGERILEYTLLKHNIPIIKLLLSYGVITRNLIINLLSYYKHNDNYFGENNIRNIIRELVNAHKRKFDELLNEIEKEYIHEEDKVLINQFRQEFGLPSAAARGPSPKSSPIPIVGPSTIPSKRSSETPAVAGPSGTPSISREKLIQSVGKQGYTVEVLKYFLRQLGLKISGKKSELVERLIPYSS